MGKLILRSIKRTSAKGKPERSDDYLDALRQAPGIYLLLLEPLFDGDELVDFTVLVSSKLVEDLEDHGPLAGQRVSTAFQSASQWLDSCKIVLESGQQLFRDIQYNINGHPAWFRGMFCKQNGWVISTWENLSPQRFQLDETVSNNKKANATNGHSNNNKLDLKHVINRTEQKEESLKDLIETERISVQAHTIRTIIHEIRNPLTAIALANQLLTEVTKEGEDSELSLTSLTSIIFQNSRKIEDHLRQLLHARPDEEVIFTAVDLCKVMEVSLQKAENRLFLSRVKVCRNLKPGNLISGHGGKLSIAFLNIIINAVEAMTNENGQLWISVYPVENAVKVIIRDNGAGMEAGVAQRIFEPYFSNKKNGLGIGLANVKEILDQHEATIKVSSEPGKGTSFTILFKQIPTPVRSKNNPAQFSLDF